MATIRQLKAISGSLNQRSGDWKGFSACYIEENPNKLNISRWKAAMSVQLNYIKQYRRNYREKLVVFSAEIAAYQP